jgi:hypothetical protein
VVISLVADLKQKILEGKGGYVHTLKYLLEKMIDPGEEFPSD